MGEGKTKSRRAVAKETHVDDSRCALIRRQCVQIDDWLIRWSITWTGVDLRKIPRQIPYRVINAVLLPTT